MTKVSDEYSYPQVTVYIGKADQVGRSRKEQAKELSRLGRDLLDKGLLELYGLDSTRVRIKKNDYGKPYLPDFPGIHFNISHSVSYAACAFGCVPLGLDIQKVQPVHFEAIARRYFTAENQKRVREADDPIHTFFRIWTEEESYGKWLGSGLAGAFAEEKKRGVGTPLSMEHEYYGMVWTKCRVQIRKINGDESFRK